MNDILYIHERYKIICQCHEKLYMQDIRTLGFGWKKEKESVRGFNWRGTYSSSFLVQKSFISGCCALLLCVSQDRVFPGAKRHIRLFIRNLFFLIKNH